MEAVLFDRTMRRIDERAEVTRCEQIEFVTEELGVGVTPSTFSVNSKTTTPENKTDSGCI